MKTIKVLLVEDDNIDQMAFKRTVKKQELPYLFTIADTVAETKKLLQSKKFDIILLDYELGDGTAFDLLDNVNGIPAVIITGAGSEEIAIRAMKQGVNDYIIKDPDLNYLKILPFTIDNTIKSATADREFAMLSHVVTSIAESVIITDLEDRIIFVNKSFCDTYGFSEEDVLGKHINILWKQAGLYDEEIGTKHIDSIWKGETYNRKKDGAEFPVYFSRSVIKNEKNVNIALVGISRDISEQKESERERKELIENLKVALAQVKTLTGMIPICASCKKIRDDKGFWNQVESYISKHTDALFSHSLCPDCARKIYPNLDPKIFDDIG